jgi:tetratricopeptide (TPR) repeat protein
LTLTGKAVTVESFLGMTGGASRCAEAFILVALALSTDAQETGKPGPADFPENLLQTLPGNGANQPDLLSALQRRDYAAAEQILASQADKNPAPRDLLLVLAKVLFLDGKQINSITVLKKAARFGPLDEPSEFLLALSYVSIGSMGLAAAEFENLARAYPSNAAYPYWQSRLAHRKTDYAKALSFARQAVALDGKFAKAVDQLGLCYAALDRNEEAVLAYKQALRLNDEQSLHWPWPALNLGTLYLRLERLSDAETALRQALLIEPRFPPAHFRLGQILEKNGESDGAVDELKEAIRLDPTYPEPHYALARIYRRRGTRQAMEQELAAFKNLREADIQRGVIRPN